MIPALNITLSPCCTGNNNVPAKAGSTSKVYVSFKLNVGDVGGPVAGSNTFAYGLLAGATDLTTILVNGTIETIGVDFTFDPNWDPGFSGQITRTNKWEAGSYVVFSFNRIITI